MFSSSLCTRVYKCSLCTCVFSIFQTFFLFFSFWDVMIHACGLDSASVNEIFILFVYAQSNLHVSTMIWENSPQSAHMHHFYRTKLKHLTARSKWWKHIFDWREALKWDSPFISNTPSTFSTLAWDDFQPIACILFFFGRESSQIVRCKLSCQNHAILYVFFFLLLLLTFRHANLQNCQMLSW